MAKDFSYIENANIKIGVITDWGAAIGYFSQITPERNLVDNDDRGRLIQQSFYGNWTDQDAGIVWNPVQAGDESANSSEVLEFSNDGTTIYSKTIPLDWKQNNVPTDSFMEQWITLDGNVAIIHYKFTYTGDVTQTPVNELLWCGPQEIPAVYCPSDLGTIKYYAGASPWTGDTLTSQAATVPPGHVFTTTENWEALVDGSSFGLGVYVPATTMGSDVAFAGDTMYMSPRNAQAFAPNSTY